MYLFYTEDYDGSHRSSRMLLSRAIDRYYKKENSVPECPPEELLETIREGDLGKPFIPGFIPYSISHTGSYWAVLLNDTTCGLDIQKWQKSNYLKLAERFYQAEEMQSVRQNGEAEFFRIWARRESFRKALGESVFTEAESVLPDWIHHGEKLYRLHDVKMPFPCYAAICIQAQEDQSGNMAWNPRNIDIEIEKL